MDGEVKFVYTLDHSDVVKKSEDIKKEIHKNAQEVEKLGLTTDEYANTIRQLMSSFEKLTSAVDKNTAAQKKAGDAGKEAGKQEKEGADRATSAIQKTKREADGLSGSFDKLTKYAAGFFTLQAAQAFARKVFDVRSEIQSLHTSFETLVGDKEKADALFNGIKEFAVKTPMQMKDLASAAQTMMSFNIPVEQIMENLKALGDVSMGDTQKFQSLSLAFSQMSATGKLMGQDLLQMINAGFNPLAVMAEKTGKSISDLKDEMSAGKVSADMVRQAFIDATREGGKFAGMLESQSQTLRGAYSNLQGAISDMFNEIGERSEGIMAGSISVVTELVKNYETVGKVILGLVGAYGYYKVAIMTNIALEKVQALSRLAHAKNVTILRLATDMLTKSTLKQNAAMLVNPYMLILTAVVALGAAIYKVATQTDIATESTKKLNETFANTQAEIASEQKKIDDLFDKLRKAKEGTDEYKTVKDQIISQYGQYLSGLSSEISSLKNVEGAYRAVSRAARDAAMARGMEAAISTAQTDYNENYSKNYDKIRKALESKFSEASVTRIMNTLQEDLRRNGKISDKNKQILKDYFRGEMNHGRMEAWVTSLNNGEQAYNNTIKLAQEKFGVQEEKQKQKEEPEKILATVAQQKADAKKALDAARKALSDFDTSNKKMTTEAALKERERLQNEVKNAEDQYKKYGGETSNGGAAGGRTVGRGGNDVAEDAARLRKELFAQEMADMERMSDERRKMEDAQEDAFIAAIANNSERERKEREAQHVRTLRGIDEQADDFKKAAYKRAEDEFNATNKDKTKVFSDTAVGMAGWQAMTLSDDQLAYLQAQRDKENSEYQRMLEERAKADRESYRNFIAEYGTYEQQRLAIAEEYAEKIREAENPYEKASLALEREAKQKELDAKQAEENIDFSGIFSDLQGHTVEYLKGLRDQLQGIISSGDLPLDQLATAREKLVEINNVITEQSNRWGEVGERQREHNRLLEEAANAQKALGEARKEQAGAAFDVSSIRGQIEDLLEQAGKDIDVPFDSTLLDQFDNTSAEYRVMASLVGKLGVAEGKLEQARKKTKTATEKAAQTEDAAKRTSAQAVADWFSDMKEKFEHFGISELPELFESIGLNSIGEKLGKGLSGFNDAAGAAADFASHNYVGAAIKGISALKNFGSALGIGGGNASEINRQLEKLSDRNEVLTDAIDRLNDTMSKQSGANAIKTYEELLRLQNELEDNLQEQIRLQMSYHEAHHSFNKEWGGVSASELSRFNSMHNTSWNGDLSSLTAEEAAAIMSDVNLRELIKNTGKGGYGQRVLDWISQLAEQAGKAKDATDALYASLTAGTTRDSVFSDFLSQMYSLADGSEDVMEDIAKNWQQMVNKMVINNLVGSKMQKKLEDWYEDLARLNEERTREGSQMTDDEYRRMLEELRLRYEGFVSSAEDEIERFTDMGIIKPMEDAASSSLITLDTIKDGWMDMLMDMSADTEDWAQDIARLMTQAMIESNIFNDEWESQQKEWLARYNEAMKDTSLTDAQRKALLKKLQEEQEQWVDENRKKVRDIMEMTGYDASTSQQQSAQVSAMERITTDQAEEIIGRLNVGQMLWQQNNELSSQILSGIESMNEIASGHGRSLAEIVTLLQTANGTLATMHSVEKKIYDEFGRKLDTISNYIRDSYA